MTNGPSQSGCIRFACLLLFSLGNKISIEFSRCAQKAWLQEVHDGPEIGKAVFDRGSRHGNVESGLKAACCLGFNRARVFDLLCLIQCHNGPIDGGPFQDVAGERFVVGDEEDVFAEIIRRNVAGVGSVQNDGIHSIGEKLARFFAPIFEQDYRCDYEVLKIGLVFLLV